jgi:hypothetical protein
MRGMHVWSYNSLPPNKVLQGTRKRRRAPEHGVQPTAGGRRGADRVERVRGYSTWDRGELMSGRLNRVRGWIRYSAACGSRTRGSNRRASGPLLSRGLC